MFFYLHTDKSMININASDAKEYQKEISVTPFLFSNLRDGLTKDIQTAVLKSSI